MQRLVVSGAVRPIEGSLGVKGLTVLRGKIAFFGSYSDPLIFCDHKSVIMCPAYRVYLQESDVVTALTVRVLNV
jgi:hypothetical protein